MNKTAELLSVYAGILGEDFPKMDVDHVYLKFASRDDTKKVRDKKHRKKMNKKSNRHRG